MEIWLAVFGLVAAVLMIWMARGRHRGGPAGTNGGRNTADHRGASKGAGNGGGNGNSSDGDGGGGGD
jgi:hypothetical protein